jgi:hypothetical protein
VAQRFAMAAKMMSRPQNKDAHPVKCYAVYVPSKFGVTNLDVELSSG